MKKTVLLGLLVVLSSAYSIGSMAISNNKTIQLGVVNGRVVNEQVIEIKKTLTDPVLFTAKQDELSKKMSKFDILNAKIITETEGNIIIDIKDETQKIQTRLNIELWGDGKKMQIQGKSIGSDVSIAVPDNVKLVELRTHRPIIIFVPRYYRGNFKFLLDIVGWSA